MTPYEPNPEDYIIDSEEFADVEIFKKKRGGVNKYKRNGNNKKTNNKKSNNNKSNNKKSKNKKSNNNKSKKKYKKTKIRTKIDKINPKFG